METTQRKTQWTYTIDFSPFWHKYDDVTNEHIEELATLAAKAIRKSPAIKNDDLWNELDNMARELEELAEALADKDIEWDRDEAVEELNWIYGNLCDLGDWNKMIWIKTR